MSDGNIFAGGAVTFIGGPQNSRGEISEHQAGDQSTVRYLPTMVARSFGGNREVGSAPVGSILVKTFDIGRKGGGAGGATAV